MRGGADGHLDGRRAPGRTIEQALSAQAALPPGLAKGMHVMYERSVFIYMDSIKAALTRRQQMSAERAASDRAR